MLTRIEEKVKIQFSAGSGRLYSERIDATSAELRIIQQDIGSISLHSAISYSALPLNKNDQMYDAIWSF